MLGGDQQLALEGGIGGAAIQSFSGRELGEIGIVVFLGDVGEDEITRAGVETVGIGEEFANGMIREMPGAGQNALLNDPRVGPDLEHVQIVIGLEDHAISFAQMNLDHFGEIAEIGADGDFGAPGAEREANGIGSIVRNGEGVDVDIADREMLAGFDGFDCFETLLERFGKNALEGVHSGLGYEQWRRFPDAQDLREAVAVIGVLVGDEDGVELIDFPSNGGQAGQGFAFAKTGVD